MVGQSHINAKNPPQSLDTHDIGFLNWSGIPGDAVEKEMWDTLSKNIVSLDDIARAGHSSAEREGSSAPTRTVWLIAYASSSITVKWLVRAPFPVSVSISE
jgi:hypothetical protein